MVGEPTNAEKMRRLPWSIAFSSLNAAYCQLVFFGSAFVLFLGELGLSKTEIGNLLSLYPFTALLSLLVAPVVARFGYKRTFLLSFGTRKMITLLLLPTPLVMAAFGPQAALALVVVAVVIFALCRAVAMTALHPWQQEYVPNAVRGKFSAMDKIFSNVTSFLAVTAAGYILGTAPDLGRFTILFAIAVPLGLAAVWAASSIPGGAPVKRRVKQARRFNLLATLRDRGFVLFLLGAGLYVLATGPLGSFLPLFMREQVGLSSGRVVWLQTGTLLGGLLSSYLWGWAADRYGSKPVMLSGIYLRMVLPIFWLLMPRQSGWSLYIALFVAVLQGVSNMGWMIGSGRLLFVSVVPPEKKASYMALRFAWMGLVGGVGKLIGGRVLDLFAGVTGEFLFFTLDPYTVLFAAGIVLPLLSGLLFRGVRGDDRVSTGEFAGMFLRGNPLGALTSMVGFHRARDERAVISMTERLGQTQSPLTVDELLEALADPRFYVRFEAIVSIARMKPDERLIDTLGKIVNGDEPALSVIAAWALGRMEDERALPPLRQGLDSRYRSVQAHCARSLGTLGDVKSAPLLLERLEQVDDQGLRLAYGSALGKLERKDALSELLALLQACQDEDARMELALALARIVEAEHRFIQLLRQTRVELGTPISQAVASLKRKASEFCAEDDDLALAFDRCAEALAREELGHGAALLGQVVQQLPLEELDEACATLLRDCVERLKEFAAQRIEYVILALCAMDVALAQRNVDIFARVFSIDRDIE